MQYDVSTAHLNSTGFAYIGRTRVKGLVISCNATGGTVTLWDSLTASTSATYEQSTTTVTITKTAHGLATGQKVGISFATATGVSATNGNYIITVTGNDTFTITDINSRTIAAGTACSYVSNVIGSNSTQWHMTVDTAAAAATTNIVFPGEGLLIENGIYVGMTTTNITAITIFYG
jgi:phage-related minor tail protein